MSNHTCEIETERVLPREWPIIEPLNILLLELSKRKAMHYIRHYLEIPAAARTLANLSNDSGRVLDAIITLGCLLRGETAHYEAIYNEVARGIGQSQQETGIPHSYGVLTCENLEQAIDRAGLKSGNKGWEAAITAVEMVSLKGKLKRGASDGR